jgi:hypothetical protein
MNSPAAAAAGNRGALGNAQLLELVICKLLLPEAKYRPSAAEVWFV